MILLAIDPGPEQSAWVLYNTDAGAPLTWSKQPNQEVLAELCQYAHTADECALEMIASYGMAVGAEVFETCLFIGRCQEAWMREHVGELPLLIYRREVKLHLCGSPRAKDPNIRQALIDRYGGKEQAIGRKASPGPLYGLSGDGWAALAVAVTAAETRALEAAA